MRIIAGKFKGNSLYLPKNSKTRPLKDIARESIFNLLSHSNKISFELKHSNVLDLFAGTGSFGLECLSRSAKSVCFVEKEKIAFEILEKNIEKLKLKNESSAYRIDVCSFIKKKKIKFNFDLIFFDPPFKNTNISNLIDLIFNNNFLRKDGIIILHRDKNTKEKLPDYFKIIEERIYGVSKVIFGKLLA
tara:strand:- start:3599 stop:4165 length:567 start_codon:yes stop_codon:yes gene_type:complete